MPPTFEDNPYAPPQAGTGHRAAVLTDGAWMGIEAVTVGLVLGIIDVHQSNTIFLSFRLLIYVLTCAYQGGRYGGRAGWSVLLLGSSLYPIQLVAIAYGYQPPYVCRSAEDALGCLILIVPCMLGFLFGFGSRGLWLMATRSRPAAIGNQPRPDANDLRWL